MKLLLKTIFLKSTLAALVTNNTENTFIPSFKSSSMDYIYDFNNDTKLGFYRGVFPLRDRKYAPAERHSIYSLIISAFELANKDAILHSEALLTKTYATYMTYITEVAKKTVEFESNKEDIYGLLRGFFDELTDLKKLIIEFYCDDNFSSTLNLNMHLELENKNLSKISSQDDFKAY